jgi:hypothetical protein
MPCKIEDLKMLPVIPQTSTVKMKKKWKTDLHGGHNQNFMSLDEAAVDEELLDEDSDDDYINRNE